MSEYAYTMKVTEKCDIYSYGVVLLELITGKAPVQPIDQGGDLVTCVRKYVRNHSFTSGILDSTLTLEDEKIVSDVLTVLKIAIRCTSMNPNDRPSMREVIQMLIESNKHEGNVIPPQVYDSASEDDVPFKDDALCMYDFPIALPKC